MKKHYHKFMMITDGNGYVIPDNMLIRNKAGSLLDIIIKVCNCGKVELYSKKLLIQNNL